MESLSGLFPSRRAVALEGARREATNQVGEFLRNPRGVSERAPSRCENRDIDDCPVQRSCQYRTAQAQGLQPLGLL